jgi:hypothetical protein
MSRPILLRVALLLYPRDRRRRDGVVLLDCAEELIAAGASTAAREAWGLAAGAMSARAGSLAELPVRAAGERLAAPVAAMVVALWGLGLARVATGGPLGRWWPLVLAGALTAFGGSVLRHRAIAVTGWLVVLALMAQSYVLNPVPQQPTRFPSSVGTLGVDLVAAFLPLTVLALPVAGLAVLGRSSIGLTVTASLLAASAPEAVWLATGLVTWDAAAYVVLFGLTMASAAIVVVLGHRAARARGGLGAPRPRHRP